MVLFAELALFPDGLVTWAVIGLALGFLAGYVLQQGQLGLIGDMTAGLVGAVGGGLAIFMYLEGTKGFLAAIGVAVVSGCILIGILRKVMSTSE